VDSVPPLIRSALSEASDSPGYPTTLGTASLRASIAGWLQRQLGVMPDPEEIVPAIGSKEPIALLPSFLGLGSGSNVVIPETAYPTYEVSALLAGARPVRADSPTQLGRSTPDLIWLNSPSNPTGKVLGIEHLRKVVQWARDRGVLVVSDECYIELGWTGGRPVSILSPDVCGDSHDGLLAVHSLSKRSNLAGYRFGFVTGDKTDDMIVHVGHCNPPTINHRTTEAYSFSSGMKLWHPAGITQIFPQDVARGPCMRGLCGAQMHAHNRSPIRNCAARSSRI